MVGTKSGKEVDEEGQSHSQYICQHFIEKLTMNLLTHLNFIYVDIYM